MNRDSNDYVKSEYKRELTGNENSVTYRKKITVSGPDEEAVRSAADRLKHI